MSDRGHIALARAHGLSTNRTLVRDTVAMMLRAPGCPLYLHYDTRMHKLVVRAAHPLRGVWRLLGPFDFGATTIAKLATEIEYLAAECRREVELRR